MDPGRTDEAAIERDLAAVIERFRGEPRAALGVRPDADVAAVRAAFMALCKRYHPAKFARRPAATLRLANEAFLGIRRAYDELLRVLAPRPAAPAPARPSAAASKTAPGFGPTRPGAPPPAARPEPSAARPEPTPPRARLEPNPPAARPEPSPPRARLALSPPAARIEPTPPRVRPDPGPPATRAEPSPPRARLEPSPPAARPEPAPPAARPESSAPPPERIPSTAPTEAGSRSTFDRALGLLRDRRWAEARPLLVELATGTPGDVRYRAYLHYVRGWESFELGKPGEARAEWQRALACDPGLGMAQWALGKTGLG